MNKPTVISATEVSDPQSFIQGLANANKQKAKENESIEKIRTGSLDEQESEALAYLENVRKQKADVSKRQILEELLAPIHSEREESLETIEAINKELNALESEYSAKTYTFLTGNYSVTANKASENIINSTKGIESTLEFFCKLDAAINGKLSASLIAYNRLYSVIKVEGLGHFALSKWEEKIIPFANFHDASYFCRLHGLQIFGEPLAGHKSKVDFILSHSVLIDARDFKEYQLELIEGKKSKIATLQGHIEKLNQQEETIKANNQ